MRIRNIYLSVDPGMKGWISHASNYSQPVGIGEVMRSVAVGLVVEDNPMNMELVCDLLEMQEHTVLQAVSGSEMLTHLKEHTPDLILMDIQLPGMDGLELTRILRSDPNTKAIPIIALTAHAMKGDEERILKQGCSGYISKPIETRTFLDTVAKFLP